MLQDPNVHKHRGNPMLRYQQLPGRVHFQKPQGHVGELAEVEDREKRIKRKKEKRHMKKGEGKIAPNEERTERPRVVYSLRGAHAGCIR